VVAVGLLRHVVEERHAAAVQGCLRILDRAQMPPGSGVVPCHGCLRCSSGLWRRLNWHAVLGLERRLTEGCRGDGASYDVDARVTRSATS